MEPPISSFFVMNIGSVEPSIGRVTNGIKSTDKFSPLTLPKPEETIVPSLRIAAKVSELEKISDTFRLFFGPSKST